jgi:ABC-type nitrate/sulfonate/bicarbonate transport system substrate-binding protein
VRSHASTVALSRIVRKAELVEAETPDLAVGLLRTGQADVVASTRVALLDYSAQLPGSRVLDGRYEANLQAIAVAKQRTGWLAYVSEFLEQAKASGLVEQAIARAGLRGIQAVGRESPLDRPSESPRSSPESPTAVNLLCLGAVGLGSILLSVADRQNLFRKHGVDVRLVPVRGTQVPELTADNPLGYIGAPAAVMRAAEGVDLRILASFDTARLSGCLITRAGIRKPQHLRGKRLGARVTGAAMWMHTVLALEKLNLDPERDEISIVEIGDPLDIIEALEAGAIDGAVLPRSQCEPLIGKDYAILLDLFPFNIYGAPDALVTRTAFLHDYPEVIEGIVAGLIEGAAFALSPRQRASVLETIKADLAITESAAANVGLLELSMIVARRPYPSIERLRDMQSIMSRSKSAALGVAINDMVDDSIVRKLDTSGFIDRTYASYGVSPNAAG